MGTVRMAFNLKPETAQQVDQLVKKADVASKAELFRNALRLYAWFVEQRSQGYDIQVCLMKGGQEERRAEILLP